MPQPLLLSHCRQHLPPLLPQFRAQLVAGANAYAQQLGEVGSAGNAARNTRASSICLPSPWRDLCCHRQGKMTELPLPLVRAEGPGSCAVHES